MATRSRVEFAAGIGVLLVSLTAALAPAPAAGPIAPADAALPAQFADYSYLTGSVSASPPDRAAAIFQHGFGVEFMDLPQAVIVGADAASYRRIDLAEDRGGAEQQGDPAPMELSPDGLRLAVGDYAAAAADLAVLDLTTADVVTHPIGSARGSIPRAWSPDARLLAFVVGAEPFQPYAALNPAPLTGDLGLLDTSTGQVRMLPDADGAGHIAFSPDGTRLAVERDHRIEIRTLDGGITRTLTLPEGHHLDGPVAWSPDGALLAVTDGRAVCQQSGSGFDGAAWDACLAGTQSKAFVDATGRQRLVPDPLVGPLGFGPVLGWSGPREVLVLDDTVASDADSQSAYWLTSVPLDGSEPRRLSRVPGAGNFGVGSFQLAAGLVPDLAITQMGSQVDRGPVSLLFAVTASVILAVLGGGLTRVLGSLRWRRTARA